MIGLFNIPPGSPLLADVHSARPRFNWEKNAHCAALFERFERRSRAKSADKIRHLKDIRAGKVVQQKQSHSADHLWEQALTRSRLLFQSQMIRRHEEEVGSSEGKEEEKNEEKDGKERREPSNTMAMSPSPKNTIARQKPRRDMDMTCSSGHTSPPAGNTPLKIDAKEKKDNLTKKSFDQYENRYEFDQTDQ